MVLIMVDPFSNFSFTKNDDGFKLKEIYNILFDRGPF